MKLTSVPGVNFAENILCVCSVSIRACSEYLTPLQ